MLATGPFLDAVRKMDDPAAEKAVAAAAGVHIVLPGYFTPGGMGFAELRTSRGATMYFLPWQGCTVVGSTDKKCTAHHPPRRPVGCDRAAAPRVSDCIGAMLAMLRASAPHCPALNALRREGPEA